MYAVKKIVGTKNLYKYSREKQRVSYVFSIMVRGLYGWCDFMSQRTLILPRP